MRVCQAVGASGSPYMDLLSPHTYPWNCSWPGGGHTITRFSCGGSTWTNAIPKYRHKMPHRFVSGSVKSRFNDMKVWPFSARIVAPGRTKLVGELRSFSSRLVRVPRIRSLVLDESPLAIIGLLTRRDIEIVRVLLVGIRSVVRLS